MDNHNSGNILLVILAGIALFGALSYSLMNSGNFATDFSTDRDKDSLRVTQAVDYAIAIQRGIERMRRYNGTSDTDISFDTAEWGFNDYEHSSAQPDRNKVFEADGGNVTWVDMSDLGIVKINGRNSVLGVGRCDGNSACKELTFFIVDVSDSFCRAINLKYLGQEIIPSEDISLGSTSTSPTDGVFDGAYHNSTGNGWDIGTDAQLVGQRTACVEQTSDSVNAFYHVLVAR